MKKFEYADEKITEREIMFAIPSIVVGVGILSLPKDLAAATVSSDGWIPLLIAGGIVAFITWVVAKISASFPQQDFLTYASKIMTKPVAIVITFLFAVIALNVAALTVRRIADISKHYLFDRTPVEVIAFTFLLLVVYGVSGSRAGLFRLNIMFLPIILFISVLILAFNIGWFKLEGLLPVFQTSFSGYMEGLGTSITSYTGFGIVWFYIALVKQPEKAPKKAVLGMFIPIVLYILFFIATIGVFGNAVTANLLYPTIELGKVVDVPGGFFQRFESIFFVIWIMAIFNSTAMALDVGVFAMNSIFKNTKKIKLIFILAPIVYLISMFPKTIVEVSTFSSIIGYTAFLFTVFTMVLLLVTAKLRGVKRGE
ncbi:endospore germination permease [Virgibacillus sp. NKC19-16]|uniref:GerAB/ArcD/ProY family transporter n=1 Tax=Virgibacillus salidurans TaxID=2831673 RepID=UPI001F2E50ED|nr:endospore germination permease [Virgibacillus sp. NKC19-16]UJL47213.1 endospore germination permease [Virgibacillus sp. NKC19-16]